jgi:hypothetical protein
MARTFISFLILAFSLSSILVCAAQDRVISGSPGVTPVVPRDPVTAETDKLSQTARIAKIGLVDAVKIAHQKVPGRPIEATLVDEKGGPLYKVTIVDETGKLHILQIDGVTGKAIEGK